MLSIDQTNETDGIEIINTVEANLKKGYGPKLAMIVVLKAETENLAKYVGIIPAKLMKSKY